MSDNDYGVEEFVDTEAIVDDYTLKKANPTDSVTMAIDYIYDGKSDENLQRLREELARPHGHGRDI